jgi:hypothetical protein
VAGYQTIEALRPILHRGPPPTPVVDRALVRPAGTVEAALIFRAGHRLSADVIADIIARRERGESYRVIGKALTVSQPSIRKYAGHIVPETGKATQGWETGARQRIKRNVEFAHRMRRAGFSYQEIGDNLGCCLSEAIRIFRPMKKHGKGGVVSCMVQRVSAVSGFTCNQLRRGDFELGGQTASDRAKARAILYWLIRHRLADMSYPRIGHCLGGFDHTTIMNGVRRADAVAEHLGLSPTLRPMAAARRLWAAEWPKAPR